MTGTLTGAAATAASTAGAVGRARAVAANGANKTSVLRELGKQAVLQGTTVGRAYYSARNYSGSGSGGSGYNGGDRPKTTEETLKEYKQNQQKEQENQKKDWDKAVKIAGKRLSQFTNK